MRIISSDGVRGVKRARFFAARLLLRRCFWAALVLLADATSGARAEQALVATAANFRPALDELEAAFEARSAHEIVVAAGSTGKIYAQIVNGAPFDIFLAADQERPRRLEDDGIAVAGAGFTYAVGRLALWDPAGGEVGPARLKDGVYRRLAIANPDLAPYGVAAREALAALGVDVSHKSSKLVFGENIGQTFAFVRTGNATLGFVALSQLSQSSAGAPGAFWVPPQALYTPIRQDAALMRRAERNEAALAFAAFLKSGEAAVIMQRFGYETE